MEETKRPLRRCPNCGSAQILAEKGRPTKDEAGIIVPTYKSFFFCDECQKTWFVDKKNRIFNVDNEMERVLKPAVDCFSDVFVLS